MGFDLGVQGVIFSRWFRNPGGVKRRAMGVGVISILDYFNICPFLLKILNCRSSLNILNLRYFEKFLMVHLIYFKIISVDFHSNNIFSQKCLSNNSSVKNHNFMEDCLTSLNRVHLRFIHAIQIFV